MARYFLEIMYSGTEFHGSQLQGSLPTVQLAIDNTLSMLFRSTIESYGASRTDEGVHALGSFYHFDTDQPIPPSFIYKMNSILPEGIALKKVFIANNENAHARFNAISRRYRYRIHTQKDPFLVNRAHYYPFTIEKERLLATAAIIKEYNHFESFSKRKTTARTFICNIHQSYWEWHENEFHYVVESNRFLRGMVRGLVGTQLKLAKANATDEDFKKIIEGKDCTKADFGVPGHGLYLEEITYPEGLLTQLELTIGNSTKNYNT